jgi:hypothetical protein
MAYGIMNGDIMVMPIITGNFSLSGAGGGGLRCASVSDKSNPAKSGVSKTFLILPSGSE